MLEPMPTGWRVFGSNTVKIATRWVMLCIAFCSLTAHLANAQSLRLVSWNADNYAAEGQYLRGKARSAQDHQQMRTILAAQQGDVIALQEVASLPAAQSLVGGGYNLAIEARCRQNASACLAPADAIYTAIAWRRDWPGAASAQPFDLPELAIDHTDECGRTRPVRGGVGIVLPQQNGHKLWILSVHLKAACKDDRIESGTLDDCQTQQAQFRILRDWIAARHRDGDAVLVAGDFNRKLLQRSDSERQQLDQMTPAPKLLIGSPRACWANLKTNFAALKQRAYERHIDFALEDRSPWIYHPKATAGVDHVLASNGIAEKAVQAEQVPLDEVQRLGDIADFLIRDCDGSLRTNLAFPDSYPSDHCPLLVEFRD